MTGLSAPPDAEFQALVRARYLNQPHEITALGARLIVGRDAPRSAVDGLALLEEAAGQQDSDAWHYLALLSAAGVARTQDWAAALDALQRAAALGHKGASRELQLLHALNLRSAPDIAHWLDGFDTQVKREAPRVTTHAGFLPLAMCKYLIDRARPGLKPAQVFDARSGQLKSNPMRTNCGSAFSLIDTDVVMQLARARIARAANVAFDSLEPLEVLHYSRGETYRPHVDFFHHTLPNYAEEMRLRGQRVRTCLVYLNASYEGGETEFPKLGFKFRGEVGEALVFDNVTAEGTGDMNTLHAGLPPASGEKWLLSQWIRERAQLAL